MAQHKFQSRNLYLLTLLISDLRPTQKLEMDLSKLVLSVTKCLKTGGIGVNSLEKLAVTI